jgi:hypothetical protein
MCISAYFSEPIKRDYDIFPLLFVILSDFLEIAFDFSNGVPLYVYLRMLITWSSGLKVISNNLCFSCL